jgi:hypothetical protein
MAAAGVLEASGEKRARTYRAGADLRAVWGAIRAQRPQAPADDPDTTLVQPPLPGLGQ